MKFSILGCGRWGSFLSWYIATKLNKPTILWGRKGSKSYETLDKNRANEYVNLSDNILLTDNLDTAIFESDVIIISISAQGLREFIKNLIASYNLQDKTIILCMKGLEENTGKRLSEVCIEEGIAPDKLAVWLGPGHIQDFTRGIPNCMTIDSHNKELTETIANNLNSDLIRFYYGNDIIGNEIGAACKNIIGIAAGILDGLGYSSLKGPLMTRGAYEVSKFITAMGGDGYTAYGLTHLGDYETTLFSAHSNNRKYGEQLARKLAFTKLAEGVATTKAVYIKALEMKIEMPITESVFNVIYNKKSIADELMALFSRSLKDEKYSF